MKKKGFTLIELLIVMILVAVMVAVAVPQYRRSVERGRAMEGLVNARAAAEQLAAYYLIHDGLPANIESFLSHDLLNNNNFAVLSTISPVAGETNQYVVTVTRNNDSGWAYQFKSTFSPEGILKIECADVNNSGDCTTLGFDSNPY